MCLQRSRRGIARAAVARSWYPGAHVHFRAERNIIEPIEAGVAGAALVLRRSSTRRCRSGPHAIVETRRGTQIAGCGRLLSDLFATEDAVLASVPAA
jgi:hypothetical protein